MLTLIHDPVALSESAVIVLSVVFIAWRLSPRQRHRRLRQRAEERWSIRRALTGATDEPSGQKQLHGQG
jgi:hypothetical protein